MTEEKFRSISTRITHSRIETLVCRAFINQHTPWSSLVRDWEPQQQQQLQRQVTVYRI